MMVTSKRVSPKVSHLTDNRPDFLLEGGPTLYGERSNRDLFRLNDEGNMSPIGIAWPEYLLLYPQFVDLYHQLYPSDPRINISHYAEERHEDEERIIRIINVADAVAIMAAAATLDAVERRKKDQEREAHVQGTRGEEAVRAQQRESAPSPREPAAQSTEAAAPVEIMHAEGRSFEAKNSTSPTEAAAGVLAEQTVAAGTEITASESPTRPEFPLSAENVVTETASNEKIPERPEERVSTEPLRAATEIAVEQATAQELPAGETTAHSENGPIPSEVVVTDNQNAAHLESGAQTAQPAQTTEAAQPAGPNELQGESNANVVRNQADQEQPHTGPPPEQPQRPGDQPPQPAAESRVERSERTQTEAPAAAPRPADDAGLSSSERETRADREERAENTRDEADAEAEQDNERIIAAGGLGASAGHQSAAYHGGGFAAHGITHAVMHSATVEPGNAGYAAATSVSTPYASMPTAATNITHAGVTPLSAAPILAASTVRAAPRKTTRIKNAASRKRSLVGKKIREEKSCAEKPTDAPAPMLDSHPLTEG